MLDRARFVSDLERQRAYCRTRSPLYARALEALARDAAAGPAWWGRLEAAWARRAFGPYYEAPLLLLGALHAEALAGRAPGLAAVLPSCGPASSADPGAAALEFLAAAPDVFWSGLADARLQTNEPARAVGWLLAASVGFGARETPFHLVDLGTSAGLTLIGDYLPRDWTLVQEDGAPAAEPPRWADSPFPVLSRVGLDAVPRDLGVADQRLRLKAGIWPDDAARHARFDKTVDLFLRLRADKSGGPRLEACPFSGMPAWLEKNRKPHPDEGLLVFNSQATDFLSDAEYEALKKGIAGAVEPWADRAFWVELEIPRGRASEWHELRVHRWLEGRFETKVLAALSAHPREVRLAKGWDFLRPLLPVRPQRITREEPPKQLSSGLYTFPSTENKK